MKLIWKTQSEYLLGKTNKFNLTNKIASFDLDNTLIITKSGKTFPINESDWKFKYDNIIEIFKKLIDNKYTIIIISNQAGIEKKKQTVEEWQTKLNKIVEMLNINIMVFCSTGQNKYRKPNSTFLNDFISNSVILNKQKSFYCGDALGRTDDFSDTDLKFAMNCRIPIKSPEKIFLNKNVGIPNINYPTINFKKFEFKFEPIDNELIIMVGFPGSGKSFLSKYISNIYNYKIINQDTIGTKIKCIKETTKFMKTNNNIIVDSTNPDIESRKIWINLANQHKYNITIIYVDTIMDISMHNNHYRNVKYNAKIVPKIAYNIYKSKFVLPNKSENINRLITFTNGTPVDPDYFKFFY
jgi:bifunctional polynucleotide phosphatase/kinase